MNRRTLLFGAAAAMFAARPARAHHSTAMYDSANPVTVKGAVKRFEWTNPHAYIYLDVPEVGEWEVELMSLNHLRSYGWTRKTVNPGDEITCTGAPAKSGVHSMIASIIKLPDGREIRS